MMIGELFNGFQQSKVKTDLEAAKPYLHQLIATPDFSVQHGLDGPKLLHVILPKNRNRAIMMIGELLNGFQQSEVKTDLEAAITYLQLSLIHISEPTRPY